MGQELVAENWQIATVEKHRAREKVYLQVHSYS